MDGIHDLGGMHGFGRVRVERDEPAFHHPWERRVWGLLRFTLGAGVGNLDKFRHAIERMAPVAYLSAGYYGRWLHAVETLLLEDGVTSAEELSAWRAALARGEEPPPTSKIEPRRVDASCLREVEREPRFAAGDRVRAAADHPAGATRLPRYARGKVGVVVEVHPAFVFPDTHAHDLGENPQHLYSVLFDGQELWGQDAEPATAISVDLFEDYLKPA